MTQIIWDEDAIPAAPEKLMPSSARLIEGVRVALRMIVAEEASLGGKARVALRSADVALNELQLRQNQTFLPDLYASLRTLAVEGVELTSIGAGAVAGLPPGIESDTAFDRGGAWIETILSLLSQQVDALRTPTDPRARYFVTRAIDSESRIFHERMRQASLPLAPMQHGFSAEAFERYLAHREPDRPPPVATEFKELFEGFQKITALVSVKRAGETEDLVIRGEKSDVFLRLDAGRVLQEYEIIRIVRDAGVPVAEPLWVETDPNLLGAQFMVSRRLPGVNPGDPLAPRTLNDAEARSIVETLARIHAIPLSDRVRSSPIGHWLDTGSLMSNTLRAIESWRQQLWTPWCNASVATVRLYNWLIDNVPQDDAPVRFLHVDYGPHNLLLDNNQVSGVLDWESARLGDPAEDLSDLLGRFQGSIEPDRAMTWYKEAGGDDISLYRLKYFAAFNNMKTLVAPLSAAAMFELKPQTPLMWSIMPLLYGSVSRNVEAKIAAAEAARAG